MSIISVRDNEKKIDERERQKTKTERNKGLIQVMASVRAWHASPSSWGGGGGGGVTFLEKYLLERGVRNFYFGGGLYCWGSNFVRRGHRILKENLKLHNPSTKSIFRITSLIYFRYIRNTH